MQAVTTVRRLQILYIDADPRNHNEIIALFAGKLPDCETTCFRNIDTAIRREEHVQQHQVVIYGSEIGDGPGVLAAVGLTLHNRFHAAKTVLFIAAQVRSDNKMNFDDVVGASDYNALATSVAALLPKQEAEPTA